MMMKKIFIQCLAISFLFTGFAWPLNLEAKNGINKAFKEESFGPNYATDATTHPSQLLNGFELSAISEEDSAYYSIKGEWEEDFSDSKYLEFVFSPAIPRDAEINSLEVKHIFLKDSANTTNITEVQYQVDFGYTGVWSSDWSSTFDISSWAQGVKITQEVPLSPPLDDILPIAVRFQAKKQSSGTAKTNHDLFILEITYNRKPMVDLIQPENNSFLNVYTETEKGYPAQRPVFKWQGTDPDNDTLVYQWQIVERQIVENTGVCDFTVPLQDEFLGATQFQPLDDRFKGVYCWRVGVSDDRGTTFYWSDHYIFTIDITRPLAPQTLKIQPAASMFTQVNRPRVFGTFSASDTDPQKAIIVFENTALNSAYIYKIPRINDSFDSNSIGSKLYYLSDISKLCLSSGIERTGLWDEVAEADYMKDGNYKVYGLSEDEAGNRTDLDNKIALAGLYKIDTQAPLAPVVSVSTEDSRAIVSWNAVEDGIYYEVYRDGNLVAYTNSTIFIEENLPQGRTYTYWVIAVDQAGNRSQPSEKKSVYIYFPRVSSVSYAPAVSYVPMEGISEVQAKEKPEEVSQLPEGEVKAEEPAPAAVAKGANWALITAIILGILLALGGGLYWWYSREEDEI